MKNWRSTFTIGKCHGTLGIGGCRIPYSSDTRKYAARAAQELSTDFPDFLEAEVVAPPIT